MKNYDDQNLRKAFAALPVDARADGTCPDSEHIWAAIEARIPVAERRRLVLHMADCPSCAEAWRLAVRMGATPPGHWRVFVDRMREGIQGFTEAIWQHHRGLAAAATAVVVVVVSVMFVNPEITGPGTTEIQGFRGIEAVVALDQPLSRQECWLRWSGVEGARYDLRVTNESLDVVATAQGLEETEYFLPEQDLAGVAPGERLLWLVEATLSSGERIPSRTFVSALR
jgi:hypothetical protein